MSWQPIETAPKDGRPVLLYGTRFGWEAQPARVCGFFNGTQWWIYGASDGEPRNNRRSIQQLDTIDPKCWMEIPSPPLKTEEKK